MDYISTRGGIKPISFKQAVVMGLADDGGLIVPSFIPDVSHLLNVWRLLPYEQLALEVFRLYATDMSTQDLKQLIGKSYLGTFDPEVAPTVPVGDILILELFHGPTMSFKDVALQFLGNLYEHILSKTGDELNILGATSGDTGSAAIHGVKGRDRINIFVMHPYKRVSPIQEKQMTTVLDDNVQNMAVKGSFDDCQNIMKSLASDLSFKKKYNIGSVNSVNWARVLAQIVYYFYSYFRTQRLCSDCIRFCVPTGNFGDVLAGWYAMQMGLPISQLMLATNENDILARFFNSGTYSRGEVHQTLSPAMDIQISSNFERYLYHRIGKDPEKLRNLMKQFNETGSLSIDLDEGERVDPKIVAATGTKQETLKTIKKYYDQYGYVMDPHTAVGVSVAEKLGTSAGPVICLSTAHPAKFPDAIEEATGKKNLARHPSIDILENMPTRCEILENDKEAVREFIRSRLDSSEQ